MINSDPERYIIEKYNNKILDKNNNIKDIYKYTNDLINLGYPILSVINQIKKIILLNNNINDINKGNIFIKLADISNLLNTGSTDFIQLLCLAIHIRHIIFY